MNYDIKMESKSDKDIQKWWFWKTDESQITPKFGAV